MADPTTDCPVCAAMQRADTKPPEHHRGHDSLTNTLKLLEQFDVTDEEAPNA